MSIPPLVCSTPPPPDQCEEDKDPVDFDLQYNLSQDDEDENNDYDYGSFSSHNFQSAMSNDKNIKMTLNNIEDISKYDESKTKEYENIEESAGNEYNNDVLLGTSTASDMKPKLDEEINIEDLGLKVNSETMTSDVDYNIEENEAPNNNVDNPVKDLNIPCINNDIEDNKNSTLPQPSEEITAEATTSNHDVYQVDVLIEEKSDDLKLDVISTPNIISNHDTLTNEPIISPNEVAIAADDDFGDFDDFQFVEPESKPATVYDNCDNPWENNAEDDSDFGNFTANFDKNVSEQLNEHSLNVENTVQSNQPDNNIKEMQTYSDDDFGDFDDFKSSANEVTSEVSPLSQQVPMLRLQSSDNEHQIIENINKVLSSLFEQEISEPASEFEGKLEALLSETWRHLLETDVRQPYIVPWNNSLGQKTLLKALCIDSRNILFGPKWSYNMPKYAANLSSAPLQPQKQQASSNMPQNELTSSTSNTDWTDPFTTDGQESCNIESESAVAQTNVTDRVDFESTSTKKSDKIYSSTPNMQQLRHINLPDTHIFTPTDSETPRSKTIHYDCGPPVLLPQPAAENSKRLDDSSTQHVSDTVVKDTEDDIEYWEFQDFKSTSEVNTAAPTAVSLHHSEQSHEKQNEIINSDSALTKPKTKTVYQTQVLLPIKMEPTMPTLNWPDPGEVKETFDDFSDFLSNSSWGNEKQDLSSEINNSKSINEFNTLNKVNDKHKVMQEIEKEATKFNNSGDFDDEFDSFKSALPPKITNDFNFDSLSNHTVNNVPSQDTSPQISSGQLSDFNYTFPTIISDKADTISVTNVTRPNEALTQNLGYISKITEPPINHNSHSSGIQMQTNLLQPMPTSSNVLSQNHQKSAQILQPLSLESYSQINWPSPGIDLQDLSRFNPVETLQSLKSDLSVSGHKGSSPVHNHKSAINNQVSDDDGWGEFVSSKPKQQLSLPKKSPVFVDDDEWTDFVSSPSVKPQNGLMNTISLNVHTNSNMQKTTNQNKFSIKTNQIALDIPTLNYVTPKSSNHKSYIDKHFQNL